MHSVSESAGGSPQKGTGGSPQKDTSDSGGSDQMGLPESGTHLHGVTIPPVTGEVAILNAVQSGLGAHPSVIKAARGMSHFGEHALGWAGLAAVGFALDRPRRRQWAGVAVGAVGAHAASIAIKRVVRRPRPSHPAVQVNVSTPSKLSFPSSHATSTTAAAVLMGRLTGLPLPAVLVPPMLLSRMVLGVHYPTDVLAGSALGAASAAAVLAAEKKFGAK